MPRIWIFKKYLVILNEVKDLETLKDDKPTE